MGQNEVVDENSITDNSSSDLFQFDTDNYNNDNTITILGFGSLLSESSSKLTFPNLKNFRLGYVPSYRRVFGHPTSIFFRRNIANYETKEMSSLSVEPVDDDIGLVISVFEVDSKNMMEDGIPSREFLEREEEFDIISVPYYELLGTNYTEKSNEKKFGLICAKSTDEAYIERWGQNRFDEHFKKYGVESIWTWTTDSGLRPCSIYLRHCYLAATSMGEVCFNSFLDETFLVDRTTTIRQYIQQYPEVLDVRPPPDLASRYSG